MLFVISSAKETNGLYKEIYMKTGAMKCRTVQSVT